MGAALEMPQKRSRLFQVLGLSQFSLTPQMLSTHRFRRSRVRHLYLAPQALFRAVTSSYINLPSFLWEKGWWGTSHWVYSLGWTAMPRYILEKPSEPWNIATSQGVRRTSRFIFPTAFLEFSLFWRERVRLLQPCACEFLPDSLVSLSVFPQGVFYPLENLADPPFPPVPFVLPERSDSMLYIGISEYFFKSASFAYFTAGAFNVTLSTKEVRRFNGWWQLAPTFNLI